MNHESRRGFARQNGMTLIEALVALLVLSIGLLGVAALQVSSLRNNHNAHLRSQATALAYDYIDRMRANRVDAMGEAYDLALADASPSNPTAIRDIDVAAWLDGLATVLPAGDGAADYDPVTGIALVTITWSERANDVDGDGALDEAATVTFVTSTEI
jgi:type IV pilus assembly protein PilV